MVIGGITGHCLYIVTSGGLSFGQIMGIVFGVLAFSLLCCLFLFYWASVKACLGIPEKDEEISKNPHHSDSDSEDEYGDDEDPENDDWLGIGLGGQETNTQSLQPNQEAPSLVEITPKAIQKTAVKKLRNHTVKENQKTSQEKMGSKIEIQPRSFQKKNLVRKPKNNLLGSGGSGGSGGTVPNTLVSPTPMMIPLSQLKNSNSSNQPSKTNNTTTSTERPTTRKVEILSHQSLF